jgi:hypothetical protein
MLGGHVEVRMPEPLAPEGSPARAAARARAIVRRIALSLPGVTEGEGRFSFGVMNAGKEKGLAWSWLERVHPKKARVPNEDVLAVRVADQLAKAALLAADPDKFFTEPHYNGYPAVLVRLAHVTEPELQKLLTDAWECQAPKELVRGAPGPRAPAAPRRGQRPPAAARPPTDGKAKRGRPETKRAATKTATAGTAGTAGKKAGTAGKKAGAAGTAGKTQRTNQKTTP